jgi:hypothetical protein
MSSLYHYYIANLTMVGPDSIYIILCRNISETVTIRKFQLGWWRSLLARRSHSCLRNPEVESSSLSHLIIFCNYVIHKDFFEWERYDLIKIIIKRLAMMLIMI